MQRQAKAGKGRAEAGKYLMHSLKVEKEDNTVGQDIGQVRKQAANTTERVSRRQAAGGKAQ